MEDTGSRLPTDWREVKGSGCRFPIVRRQRTAGADLPTDKMTIHTVVSDFPTGRRQRAVGPESRLPHCQVA